ncbi:allophanate hydrolase [Streptomyces sp. NPDC058572]|uniref:allophanate hydrolase n=1 Tax=Streptomyces sp. NPDC058572 TaxID=3346546 RepID=UPI00365E590E
MPATALDRVRDAYARIAHVRRPDVWITLRPLAEAEEDARAVDRRLAAGEQLPLAGRTLAVKANIDIAGIPTTAGCPSYGYRPAADATAVARLKAAGAIVLGSTNMDQFATGLVGTRSPYGAVPSVLDPARVAGGSSSGSAVAVALGIADLALGTDTAGSGRVPAAFNNIVGLKPSRGLVPTDGVVPACASLDCVSVFARTLPEAELALALVSSPPGRRAPHRSPGPWRIAVPTNAQLGEMDDGWAEAFEAAAARLAAAGARLVPVDLTPFTEAAAMLYEGAFVAERYTAVGAFVDKETPDLDPTVASIIRGARDIPAHRLFADQARLAELRIRAMAGFAAEEADALLLPTTPGHPTLADVAADPIGVNARLGRFTNSTNLFDLAAVAVPAGVLEDGHPFGVMLTGPAGTDDRLARIAAHLTPPARIAVVGAHLTGEPLNHELLALGGRLLSRTSTAPVYRLFALRTDPPKPGLVHTGQGGTAVEAEVWELPVQGLGILTAALPRPMAIGRVELADGTTAPGFLCEPGAVQDAEDISHHGGWRAYRSS